MSKGERENKKRILVLSDYYLPGYKSGGGMRTIVNMVDRLKDRFEFFIVTRDHDGKLDRAQYNSVKINQWNQIRGAEVFYVSKENFKIAKIRELIVRVNPDAIYSNSYFATFTVYLLILKKLKFIPTVKVILAPCGELSIGALQLNTVKKKIFLKLAEQLDLYANLIWKASTELEKNEIQAVKGSGGKILIAPDILPCKIFENFQPELKPQKTSGEAKMIFLSRFMKKKNFKWLLENLSGIAGKLEIDIYGPLENAEYWRECEKIIELLPDNIKVRARGSVPHEQVLQTLAAYHFFVMPTLGENFGHIFLESLAAGCPLLISDRTPWLELEKKGIGWDLSLDKPEIWINKLNYCIEIDQEKYSELSSRARQYALKIINDKKFEQETLKVLNAGLSMT